MAFTLKGKKSLTSILATFQKTLTELQTLTEVNNSEVAKNQTQIASLQETNSNLDAETKQATVVADNLKAILGQK